MSRLSQTVRSHVQERADGACEYCRVHESDFTAATTFELDHIRPQHLFALDDPARDDPANLAYSCPRCNRYKGVAIAAFDPETGCQERLFHPRCNVWLEHFTYTPAGRIFGKTGSGRATKDRLKFNLPERVINRLDLLMRGKWPHPLSEE